MGQTFGALHCHDSLITLREARAILGLTPSGLSCAIRSGRLRRFGAPFTRLVLREEVEAYRIRRTICQFCGRKRSRPTALGKWCSTSCRGRAARAKMTPDQKEKYRVWRRASKWWRRPWAAEKHRQHHRDWYERRGRELSGHAARGTRWTLPESQIRDLVKAELPGDEIRFFDRKTVGTELDVFNVTRNWVIDIRGPYHYVPIHGTEHLRKVRLADRRRERGCREKGIRILIIRAMKTGRGGLTSRQIAIVRRLCRV